jgi:hypothetical protein
VQIGKLKKESHPITGLVTSTWEIVAQGEPIGKIQATQMGILVSVDTYIYEKEDFGQLIRQLIVAYDEYDSLRPQLARPS